MFKTGDVVMLKSGGPKMTVQRVLGDKDDPLPPMVEKALRLQQGTRQGDPVCQWFEGKELKGQSFRSEMLQLVNGEPAQ